MSRWKSPQDGLLEQKKFHYEGGEKMNRIRKGFAALLAAAFLFSAGGVAQAVVGIPDDVPGSTLLFPFFKVNPNRTASDTQDTLLVVTNTAGATSNNTAVALDLRQSAVAPNIAVHFTIWSTKSRHLYDFSVILTPHDVFSCSLYDLLVGGTGCANPKGGSTIPPAPLGIAPQLQVTIGGQVILAGYVTADLVYAPTFLFPGESGYPFAYGNILVGHMYLVNLINGSSTGFNAVSIEAAQPCYGHPAVADAAATAANSFGFYRTRCGEPEGLGSPASCATVTPAAASCQQTSVPYSDYTERIDGPNGDFAQTGTAGGFAGIVPDSPLSLIVRYFSLSAITARSELWSWRDRVPGATSLNVAVYDEEENFFSVGFSVADEVSFSLTADIITPGVPGGWFRVKYLCGSFSSCTYSYTAPVGGTSAVPPPIQSVGYSVQFAQSSNASLRWDAVFPAHRQYSNYANISE